MIYAIDFDGTLYQNDALNMDMVTRIQELRSAGDEVYVHTSRQGKALKAAEKVLQDVELDGIVGGKFFADYYVDDKNMTITDFLKTEEARKLTPNDRTKFKDVAQTRAMLLSPTIPETEKRFDTEKYVEGYAAKYDTYLLYDDGDWGKTYERFEPGCFENTDMSDVILQYDHRGRVFARNTNGTLLVETDDVGLFIAADLDKTELARGLYEDIAAKMITKMSWRFRPGKYYIERTEGSRDITIVHTEIKKIYDVSAVSIPANDDTEINARAWVDGEIAQAARREAELNERRRRLRVKINTATGGI